MAEELSVVLRRTSESVGLGFSLLGTAGLPPIIYDIVENSPAAECGEVEAGDVILKVNETDVNRFSTKEVLKCLRLSENPIRLRLKRDPVIKAKVIELLSNAHQGMDDNTQPAEQIVPPDLEQMKTAEQLNEDPFMADRELFKFNKNKPPRFETFMMTGDLILNLSRTQQTSGILPKHQKKVDSLRYHRHEHHNSVPTSPNETELGLRKSSLSTPPESPPSTQELKSSGATSCYSFQTGVRTSRSEDHLQFQKDPSLSTVDIDIDDDVTSSLNTLLDTRLDCAAGSGIHSVAEQSQTLAEREDKSSESLEQSSTTATTVLHLPVERRVCACAESEPKNNNNNTASHSYSNSYSNSCGVTMREKRRSTHSDDEHRRVDEKHHRHSSHSSHIEDKHHRHSGHYDRHKEGTEDKTEHRRSGHFDRKDSSRQHCCDKDGSRQHSCDKDGSRQHSCDKDSSRQHACDKDSSRQHACDKDSSRQHSCDKDGSRQHSCDKDSSRQHACDKDSSRQHACDKDSSRQHSCDKDSSRQHSCDKDSSRQHACDKDSSRQHSCDGIKSSDSKHDGITPKADRIVWTYNAPNPNGSNGSPSHSGGSGSGSEHNWCCGNGSTLSSSSSPQRSLSPQSPTSVSSSIMSSNSSSFKKAQEAGRAVDLVQNVNPEPPDHWNCVNASDLSASEAVSNISSPDYQEEVTMDILSTRDMLMEISDPSDSDSTILVSDPVQSSHRHNHRNSNGGDHRIIIHVKGLEGRANGRCLPKQNGYQHDLATSHEHGHCDEGCEEHVTKSPPSHSGSEDDSDVESLHSFHYSPKAVDLPSAVRLAKRLFNLDGFKKSDVSRHLSKNNDFSRAVADEYLRYFSFDQDSLDVALRKFLKQFSLTGETQERERVLVHFSKRYLDCNLGSFNSQDAVHTLTCAIMLLNTDIHGHNISRKMSCEEFIDNLRELNEGENFPRDVLKGLYQAIKNYPLEWALDDEDEEEQQQLADGEKNDLTTLCANPFLGIPNAAQAIEYKKGYVMRKSCVDPNGKKTPFGKRGWRMYYCTLRDLVLYLHKDEHGFRKTQLTDNLHNAIRIHHSLATKAQDYNKKQHVFRLETAERAEYLFQTSDSKELQSWVDTINLVCASYSAQPLPGAVGSDNKFQRPLLPCSHTKLNLREQLADHEARVKKLEADLEEHRRRPPERSAKSLVIQNHKEKDAYLQYEIRRYKTYAHIIRSRMPHYNELEGSLVETSIGEESDCQSPPMGGGIVPPPVPDRRMPPCNSLATLIVHQGCAHWGAAYNYRAAVYTSNAAAAPDIG